MNPVEWLKAQRCQAVRYLGDGVYAGTDGYQIWLCCERSGSRDTPLHYIALDAPTMKALVDYDAELRRPQAPEEPRLATEEEAQRGLNDTWPGDPV